MGSDVGQATPVGSAQRFRNDLGKDKNHQGEYGRNDANPGTAKHNGSLGTRTDSTHSMGDGIQRQYRCQRLVNIAFQLA